MKSIMRTVVVALLAVWCFPAVSLAQPMPATPPPLPAVVTTTSAAAATESQSGTAETAQLAAREKQSQDLQNWKGGEGVSIYVGSGVLLVAVIVLLILLL
jgi:hypothetical protein